MIAIAFWTWIWGPLGLALATPLTVCLVVLCKHIPELEFAEVLLGDESAVDPPLIYYQRLLARDIDEASDVVKNYLKDHLEEGIYDDLFIPALHWAKRDSVREKLDPDDQRFIVQTTREIIENLEELNPIPPRTPADPGVPPPSGCESLVSRRGTRPTNSVC